MGAQTGTDHLNGHQRGGCNHKPMICIAMNREMAPSNGKLAATPPSQQHRNPQDAAVTADLLPTGRSSQGQHPMTTNHDNHRYVFGYATLGVWLAAIMVKCQLVRSFTGGLNRKTTGESSVKIAVTCTHRHTHARARTHTHTCPAPRRKMQCPTCVSCFKKRVAAHCKV